MPGGPSNHEFADATSSQIHGLSSQHCKLTIRQQPAQCKVTVAKEKERKPVDPPPVVQLQVSTEMDKYQNFLQSPYFFMTVHLLPESDNAKLSAVKDSAKPPMTGALVSSLHRLKDPKYEGDGDGAFFIFGDISISIPGRFRLQFTLYEMRQDECAFITLAVSDPFPVLSAKNFAGMLESTHLTRSFSEQGVRLRIRKAPRTLLRKRGPADDNYERRKNKKVGDRADQQDTVASGTQEHQRRDNEAHLAYSDSQAPWEQRPISSRKFSQHSDTAFHPSADSYGGQQPAKRPRTGSNQHPSSATFDRTGSNQHPSSATFDQVDPSTLDTSPFTSRHFSETQQNYTSYTPSHSAYGNHSYTQPHQSANYSRSHYLPDRTESTGAVTLSDGSISRSPLDAQFPPRPQDSQYGSLHSLPYVALEPPTSSSRHYSPQNPSHPMAFGSNSSVYHNSGSYEMPPPPMGYSAMPPPVIARRQDYRTYPTGGVNSNTSPDHPGPGPYSQT